MSQRFHGPMSSLRQAPPRSAPAGRAGAPDPIFGASPAGTPRHGAARNSLPFMFYPSDHRPAKQGNF